MKSDRNFHNHMDHDKVDHHDILGLDVDCAGGNCYGFVIGYDVYFDEKWTFGVPSHQNERIVSASFGRFESC